MAPRGAFLPIYVQQVMSRTWRQCIVNATHLKANGEDVKVVQESLHHANSRITLYTYAQALTPAKREAQKQSCEDDLAGADSNCSGGRREVNSLIVPFCFHAGKPNFPQTLEKNGGDDETRTRDLCRDSSTNDDDSK